jgi:hypothetical protein
MSHGITIRLNRPANEFQAGESVGFGIGGGVQYYDRATKQKEWTNYKAVVFAKAGNQADFYRQALVENAVVEIGAKQQKISEYNGIYSIEFIDAWIGSINQYAPRQEQAAPQQQAAIQRTQQQTPANNFDDEFNQNIPF